MIISEKMFQIMKEKGITQAELARRTGISTKTISDWRQKKTNPGADKIMCICIALEITPEVLLLEKDDSALEKQGQILSDISEEEKRLIKYYRELPDSTRKRLMAYAMLLSGLKQE